KEASEKHHEYEQNFLNDEVDQNWAAWYAAYILGKSKELKNKINPSKLTAYLEEVASRFKGENWAERYADFVFEKIA
ncbi:MAG: hypothetical protein ABEI74_01545, partial [Candidatus Pacearchaeota archaeon]